MSRTAMILAAGEGTRLKPLTNDTPKALVSLHGIPMLEILVRKLVKAGFEKIIINVHHFGNQITDFVNSKKGFGAEVIFSREDILLDTGGGIKKAARFLGKEPVLFHNVDILADIDLASYYSDHLEWGGEASLVIKERPTSRYLLFNNNMYLSGWYQPEKRIRIISRKSKQGYYDAAFSGIYILNPSVFEDFPDEEVFSLTPWLLERSGKMDILGWNQGRKYWYDMGTADKLSNTHKKVVVNPDDPYSFIGV